MIVAGFGFRTGAGVESLADALANAGERPDKVTTLADKASEPVFQSFAAQQGLPVVLVLPADAEKQRTPTQSAASKAAHATGSVAEATALAAAGPGARLLTPRAISADRMATCALAIGEGP